MSNNKQTMKLYTEEKLINSMLSMKTYIKVYTESVIDKIVKNHVDSLTPIELPSDEEIKTYLNNHSYEFEHGFKDAIEFMKNKIGGKQMSNNKQSSVDFLFQNMFELSQTLVTSGETQYELMMQVYQQAKAMHKEEIETAFDKGADIGCDIGSNHDWHEGHNKGHQYYKETFGGDK